jgi:hypothetical protein
LTRNFARLSVLENMHVAPPRHTGPSISNCGIVMESGHVRLAGAHEEMLRNPEISHLYLGDGRHDVASIEPRGVMTPREGTQ